MKQNRIYEIELTACNKIAQVVDRIPTNAVIIFFVMTLIISILLW